MWSGAPGGMRLILLDLQRKYIHTVVRRGQHWVGSPWGWNYWPTRASVEFLSWHHLITAILSWHFVIVAPFVYWPVVSAGTCLKNGPRHWYHSISSSVLYSFCPGTNLMKRDPHAFNSIEHDLCKAQWKDDLILSTFYRSCLLICWEARYSAEILIAFYWDEFFHFPA